MDRFKMERSFISRLTCRASVMGVAMLWRAKGLLAEDDLLLALEQWERELAELELGRNVEAKAGR